MIIARRNITVFFWICSLVIPALLSIYVLISIDKMGKEKIIERFHKIYYRTRPYARTLFLGIPSSQYPNDNWVMQEIISELKPDLIIETGTGSGGTALFYATVLEKVNENGKVITVDVNPPPPDVFQFTTWKQRVEFILGSSTSSEVVEQIAPRVKGRKVLVTLDADHSKEFVLKELNLYSPFVSLGSYIVVQDTHLGGHPNDHFSVRKGSGPWEAREEFLKVNKYFKIDRSREKNLITQYPSGFLKRIK